MPSFDHEIHVELFRQAPVLALELLRRCAQIDLVGEAELGSVDLSQVTPTEFRADVVVVVRDPARVAIAAVVVEVQVSRDAAKRWTWPVYLATLRARHACPVYLLVLAPEAALAEVARRPIALGHPGFTLTPIVISYADVPRDPAAGEGDPAMLPELLVLSAVAHPEAGAVEAALRAILGLPVELRELYWQYVLEAAPGALPYGLEVEMTPERRQEIVAYLGDRLAIKYAKLVREEGQREGREEGREEGQREGRERGQRLALTRVLNARFGDLPPGLDERLARLGEPELGQLLTAAATLPALAAVLALMLELERADPRTI